MSATIKFDTKPSHDSSGNTLLYFTLTVTAGTTSQTGFAPPYFSNIQYVIIPASVVKNNGNSPPTFDLSAIPGNGTFDGVVVGL